MKNLPLVGLACLGVAYGVTLSLPATAANLSKRDGSAADDNCAKTLCAPTFVELALVLDGSDSITETVFQQQLDIYKTVFSSSKFYEEILAPLPTKSIAVSVFQFGFDATTAEIVRQDVGWTLLNNQSSAENFANLFDGITKMGGIFTPLGNGIDEAHKGLRGNSFAGEYLVMDINSDGYTFLESIPWDDATVAAYNDGINAINAISLDPETVPDDQPVLDNIVSLTDEGGNPLIPSNPNAKWNNPSNTAGFLQDAKGDIKVYQQLLANKIAKETLPPDVYDPKKDYLKPDDTDITEKVPEPSLLWGLLGLGFLGIVGKGIRYQ